MNNRRYSATALAALIALETAEFATEHPTEEACRGTIMCVAANTAYNPLFFAPDAPERPLSPMRPAAASTAMASWATTAPSPAAPSATMFRL